MRKKKIYVPLIAALMVFFTVALAGIVSAAELVTAEVTGTVNDVTVTQGSSANFTIDVYATGAIACTVASGSPSTATVDTVYFLDSGGALSTGTPSSSMAFFSDGTSQGGSGNCGVTWTNAPTNYSRAASVSTAATTPVGDYTITLSVAAGTTDVTNASGITGKLGDTTATSVTVHVVAPVVTNTPPTVVVTGVTHGGSYNKGSVPAAGCSWTDTEDGSGTFAATLSAITGTYASDGIGSQTASCSYMDTGGLTATASATYSIVDPSAPVITYVLNPAAPQSNGWYNTNVTLTWTVTENESPNSLSKTGCVNQNITADQAETTYSCSATSAGGSAGPVSVSIKRDATAPTVAYKSASGTAGNAGWYVSAVTATFTGTDNLSGFDAIGTLTKDLTSVSSGEGAGVSVGSPAFTDWANNTAAEGSATHSFDIDLTNPTVTCGSTPSLILNQPGAQVSATVTDDQSGPFASPVTAAANTSAVGSFTASVTGYDIAGRFATVSCPYNVGYNFTGFYQPIDNTVANSAKAGQAVPVKWRLTDYYGVGISDPASFVSVSSSTAGGSCGGTVDAIEEYAGSSGLLYLGDGNWQYNWKTPKSYAGSCRTMKLYLLGSGSPYKTADFQFK
ncbi:MAG TPA: PxKF domain-containing protein [Actinomycetota bacterium]